MARMLEVQSIIRHCSYRRQHDNSESLIVLYSLSSKRSMTKRLLNLYIFVIYYTHIANLKQ